MNIKTLDKKILNKNDLKISFIFMILAGLGGLLTGLYQIPLLGSEQLQGMSKELFLIIITIQSALLYGLILGFLGLKLSRATNLNKGLLQTIFTEKKYRFNFNSIKLALFFGFINAVVITFSEKFIFSKFIPEIANLTSTFSPLYLLSGIVYGGIVEEIMLRLFFMSLIAFILYKILARKKDKEHIPQSFYWGSIIISALVFALGHLPTTYLTFNVTAIVLLRMLFLNTFAGVLFGYLYWKKGLEYSIISHMFSHIFMQLLFLPILF